MARRTITVSDLSGADIAEGQEAQIKVIEYPGLGRPVRLDASDDEVAQLKLGTKVLALLEISTSDGTTERVAVDVADLKRAVKGDVEEIIAHAEPAYVAPQTEAGAPRRRGRRPRGEGGAARGEKIDYSDVRFAGRVKRGIISDAEKQTVREHFDEVNEHLAAAGQRTLDLSNIEHVTKYGLEELAEERGITPTAK
jgi:hypothetical protein